MIYSKSTPKKLVKKVLISWLVIFILGTCIGIGGYATYKAITDESSNKFGDSREFKQEMSMDWSSSYDLGFKTIDLPIDQGIQEFIYCLSYGYNIDYAFVLGLIDQESSFNVDCISETNDSGLFQINEINHEFMKSNLGLDNISDPYQNTRAGLFMLRKLFEKYEDPQKVLMAYNMGETGASVLWNKGIKSTPYSESVMKKAQKYQEKINEKGEKEND